MPCLFFAALSSPHRGARPNRLGCPAPPSRRLHPSISVDFAISPIDLPFRLRYKFVHSFTVFGEPHASANVYTPISHLGKRSSLVRRGRALSCGLSSG